MTVKQKNIPWLGAFLETFFSTLPFLSVISFVSITMVLYASARPYLLQYAPWMTLWLFLGIVVMLGITGMWLVYKFVLPSIWAFRGTQLFNQETAPANRVKKSGITVAVSGGFDPLNGKGHITHIQQAKKLGNWLIIILSRDDQLVAKGNKPSGTFYPNISERISILEEFRSVDEIVINIDTDGTCAETLKMIKPNIFAKGGDRTPDNMPLNELKVCEEIGCQVVYNVGVEKKTSSSELIRRAKK